MRDKEKEEPELILRFLVWLQGVGDAKRKYWFGIFQVVFEVSAGHLYINVIGQPCLEIRS